MGIEKRQYIRHPSDVPILFKLTGYDPAPRKEPLRNISLGGLCFRSNIPFDPGTELLIEINLVRPVFSAEAVVVWRRPNEGGGYDVGVQFIDENANLRARIVEQLCHIEQYKQDVLATERRDLSGEEAAQEWIEKYADEFPRP